jgi:hypothetical protein
MYRVNGIKAGIVELRNFYLLACTEKRNDWTGGRMRVVAYQVVYVRKFVVESLS